MMISKFSWKAYIPALIIAVLIAVLIFVGIVVLDPASAKLILPITPLFLFPVLALVWLIYGECRTKIIRVELNMDHLIIRRYFGLSKPATYYYTDLAGFTTTVLPAQSTSYEYLYIKYGGKNAGKLSAFYHRNYADMKAELRTRISDLGYVDFSYLDEVKEIFS